MKAYHRLLGPGPTNGNSTIKVSIWKRIAPHLPSLLLLTVLVCLSYPWWFQSGGPAYDDLTRLNAPQRMYLGWAFRHGYLPLWNPFNFGGQPFLAAGQSGPLYLPNLLFVVFPIVTAFKLSYAFHALLAAFGCYLTSYHLAKNRYAAVAAGVVFVTCGFLVGHQIHTQMYDAVCYLPMLLYLTLRTFRHPSKRLIFGIAFCGALEIYAGHPQMTFDELCFLLVIALSMTVIRRNRQSLAAMVHLCIGGTLAVLLSAPQLLSTLQLVTYSDRQKPPASFLLHLSMPTHGWLQFLTPFTAGGGYSDIPFSIANYSSLYGPQVFWELTCYAGVTALVLAVTAAIVALRQHAAVASLTVAAVLSTLFAMGSKGPMKDVLVDVPGFDLFRIPGRFVLLDDFVIAILCSIGIARLGEAIATGKGWQQRVLTICGLVCLIPLVWMGVTHFSPAGWSTVEVPIVLLLALFVPLWLMSRSMGEQEGKSQDLRGRIASAWLVLVVLADVTVQAAWQTPYVLEPKPSYTNADHLTNFVEQHIQTNPSLEKIASLPNAPLAFDESSSFQIPSLNGYDSLEPSWYAWNVGLTWDASRLLSSARTMIDAYGVKYVITGPLDGIPFSFQSLGSSSWSGTIPGSTSPAAALQLAVHTSGPKSAQTEALLAVTVTSGTDSWSTVVSGNRSNTEVIIPLPAGWPSLQKTTLSLRCETWMDSVRVDSAAWLTASGLSRAYGLHQTLYPEPLKEVYQDSTGTVWENGAATSGSTVTTSLDNPLSASTGSATATSMTPNREVWQARASKSGYLVLGQTYDPNWRAYVDGTEVSPVQAGFIYGNVLTGIPIDAGTHKVVMVYHPEPFYVGLYVAGATLLVLTLLLVLHAARRKRYV